MDTGAQSIRQRKPDEPFAWLQRQNRGSAYVSYAEFSDHSACSFDFGENGFAASSNYGGELLQMTIPSTSHGIIFAHGDFEYSLYLALARGQRERGGKASFGLKLATSSKSIESHGKQLRDQKSATNISHQRHHLPAVTSTSSITAAAEEEADAEAEAKATAATTGAALPPSRLCLNSMLDRGCFNHRWPFNEYSLRVETPISPNSNHLHPLKRSNTFSNINPSLKEKKTKDLKQEEVGVCSILSFVKDGVLYQVLRLDYNCPADLDNTELGLVIEPPMRLQKFSDLNQKKCEEETPGERQVKGEETEFVMKDERPTRDGGTVSTYVNIGQNSEIRWEANLREFDIESQKYNVIPLNRNLKKDDHCSKGGRGVSSPVYKAVVSHHASKSLRIFIASFCIFEVQPGNSPRNETILPSHPPTNIAQFIGIDSNNVMATANMWQSIFVDRQGKLTALSKLSESNLTARCLEKILEVDLVPTDVSSNSQEPRPRALVSNMFLKANVDTKALFWKVRFLVKTDKLLTKVIQSDPHKSTEIQSQKDFDGTLFRVQCPSSEVYDNNKKQNISTIDATVRRIRAAIGGIMAYILQELRKPSTRSSLLREDGTIGDSNYYYVMVTIWYISKHYPNVKWTWHEKAKGNQGVQCGLDLLGSSTHLLKINSSPVLSELHPLSINKDKDALLRWFHYESIWQLQKIQPQIVPVAWEADKSRLEALRFEARVAVCERISSGQPYRAEDEIVDRLVFLTKELLPKDRRCAAITSHIIRRIETRQFTEKINHCHLLPGTQGYTDGPWETHALCHHSRLVISCRKMCKNDDDLTREEREEEVEHFRQKFSSFLTSEVSVVPCWERNNSAIRRGFLRSEATAVLGATILDIFYQDLKFFATKDAREAQERSRSHTSASTGASSEIQQRNNRKDRPNNRTLYFGGTMRHLKLSGETTTIEDLLALQLGALQRLASAQKWEPYIDYLQFKPPRTFHPEEFFNSLDDTPELYQEPLINMTRVPATIHKILSQTYFDASTIKKLPERLRVVLEDKPFLDDELMHLDIAASNSRGGRFQKADLGKLPKEISDALDGSFSSQDIKQLQNATKAAIDGKSLNLENLEKMVGEKMESLVLIDLKFPNRMPSYKPVPTYGKFKDLGDSLVDLEVRHRLMIGRSSRILPTNLLRLFVYVLHREMVDCFENHTLGVPRFVLQQRSTVVTHITLPSWSIQRPTNQSISKVANQAIHALGSLTNEECISLPLELRDAFKRNQKPDNSSVAPPDLELKVSSIGLSTNEFGDFSKCSIITDLLPGDDLNALKSLGELIQEIWDQFVHQPQTGRFVVFAVLLGLVCRHIAANYDAVVREFVRNFDFDNLSASYRNDSDRLQVRYSQEKLQLSLWSLEALYRLRNTMFVLVQTVEQAKTDLCKEIENGPGRRSEELDSIRTMHLESLERSLAELTAVQTRLERKVELNSRYANALSTVLALRDSRAQFRQNETIQILTYITIGFLPIALAASVFAIPKEQYVVDEKMGLRKFIGTVVGFFAAIFAIAHLLSRGRFYWRRFKVSWVPGMHLWLSNVRNYAPTQWAQDSGGNGKSEPEPPNNGRTPDGSQIQVDHYEGEPKGRRGEGADNGSPV